MKQVYTKMTVQCERFALNEAICAGCSGSSYSVLSVAGGAVCDVCRTGDHKWLVIDRDKSGDYSNGDYAMSLGGNRFDGLHNIDAQPYKHPGSLFTVNTAVGEVSGGKIVKINTAGTNVSFLETVTGDLTQLIESGVITIDEGGSITTVVAS